MGRVDPTLIGDLEEKVAVGLQTFVGLRQIDEVAGAQIKKGGELGRSLLRIPRARVWPRADTSCRPI